MGSLGRLGAILGPSWAVLGPFSTVLEPNRADFGPNLKLILERFLSKFRTNLWVIFGTRFEQVLEPVLDQF